MDPSQQPQKKTKSRSCLPVVGWLVVLVLAIILTIFFAATSLHDLGVWDEFWDMVRR